MPTPYIGVTGFTTPEQVRGALDVVPDNAQRKVMVGVLMSQKTMRGETNKWPQRYPLVHDVAKIFSDDPRALNLIHYNTKEPETLFEQLMQATHIGRRNLHGFQLNIPWPDQKELAAYKKVYPEKIIVLQLGQHALEMVNEIPSRLAIELEYYAEVIDYILIDPSGGLGKPFDPLKALGYLRALRASDLPLYFGFGVAGGLSPATLDLVQPLLSEFPDISIDAEGRLRDTNDRLDINVARQYVAQAFYLLGK